MLEIFIFAFVVMYTPGPVNMVSMFAGISGQGWRAFQFCMGVGVAMGFLFALLGYLGSSIVTPSIQGGAALIGGLYIGYLALKILKSSFATSSLQHSEADMSFMTGLVMQLTNPKAMVVILPVVTVQYPNAHIEGLSVLLMAMALGTMACGAPSAYLAAGSQLKQAVLNPIIMKWVKRVMGLMLLLLAGQFLIEATKILL